jgi:hypothetical protein
MTIEAREQGNLIGSDKVEGTAVYGANNEKIGSIERVMIDKISGKVSYAVLSFGGFFGNWRRPLSASVAISQVRYGARRLPNRHYAEAVGRGSEVRKRQFVGLGRRIPNPGGQ